MEKEDLDVQKKEVAYFMRRLYHKNLTTTSGGNISIKLMCGKILITPSGTDKARMKSDQIGLLSFSGENLTPHLTPSMESRLHIAVYNQRPDITAIIHAHPPISTAFTAMRKSINCTLTSEARAILGTPMVAPYALMGTALLADQVAETAKLANVILMENHGVICLGQSLLAAFDRMEVLEAAAKMTLITELLKGKKELSPQKLREIDDLLATNF
jgi:L-fuculose-phosphate aldolase